ncbi:MAG: hypothetical protein V3T53_02015 [Phycisphaerales bacterium]
MEHRIEFDLTEEDLAAYHRDEIRSSSTRRKQHWVIICMVVCIPLLLAGPSVVQGSTLDPFQYMILALSGVLLIALPLYWRIEPGINARRSVRRLAGTRLDPVGPMRVTIDPQRIVFERSSFGVWANWGMISSTRATQDHFYITIAESSTVITPARVFDNRGDFDQFTERINGYRDASPSYERTCPTCSYDLSGSASAGCPECGWRREE